MALMLSGCLGSVITTGASLFYDRHNLYKKAGDFNLSGLAGHALYQDRRLKCRYCYLDLEVFNGDILLAGHVPTRSLRALAKSRIERISGYRRIFIQVGIQKRGRNTLQDTWITAKIRSQIISDSHINPKKVKVVTADNIVYLMGDVLPNQGKKVIEIARHTAGVKRVVKLFNYYQLVGSSSQSHP